MSTTWLDDVCWLRHEEAWLGREAADEAFDAMTSSLDWEQREIMLFGKPVREPRLVAWAGDVPYRYSGQTLPVRAAPAALQALLESVCVALDHEFNHVLANRYRDGADSMGMHADDEPELGADPFVASLSLGATRRFLVTPNEAGERLAVPLGHGDLLAMGGAFQHRYRHGVPKQSLPVGERISLTFRRIETSGGASTAGLDPEA
jgi:alkylated DNA repair dioxygenase AlkB